MAFRMLGEGSTQVAGGNNSVRWISTIIVLAHLIVVVLHGNAHTDLQIQLDAWQKVFVMTVIVVAPLVAIVIVWTLYYRIGVLLLLVSMAGALVFGACYHYVISSPDHVSHLPPGDAQGLFRATALVLAVTELLGVVVAVGGLRRASDASRSRNRSR
jgi:hypothetical protein